MLQYTVALINLSQDYSTWLALLNLTSIIISIWCVCFSKLLNSLYIFFVYQFIKIIEKSK